MANPPVRPPVPGFDARWQRLVPRRSTTPLARPKAMRELKERVDELAKRYVDKMREIGPECDFVTDIAVDFPLHVILSLLGLPESDFPRMHKLTQEMLGGDDAEHQRGQAAENMLEVLLDFFNYFATLTASRREEPTKDLASAIANGRIDGEPLSDMDTAPTT